MNQQSLGRQAARGAAATGASLAMRISLQLVSVVILARLLGPSQYGLVAMVVAVVGVADTVRDFGLSSAAIQAPELSTAQRSNLFWVNTGIGLALATVIFALASPIAAFYHEPRLVGITRVLATMFLLDGMMTQYRASLLRAMRFRVIAFADALAPMVALVGAIVLALLGAGYWALVSQQIVSSVVALLVVVWAGRWLPGRWRRGEPMRPFFRFGGHLLGSQIIGYVANNVDSLTIGHRFGAAPLGTYNRAFQLLMNPLNQVRSPSTTVALPVLSRATEGDEFDRIVKRGQLVLAYPVALGLALVIGTARPLVDVLLGDQWTAVPPILQLLAVAGVLQTLAYVGYWVYLARGLTRQLMYYTLVTSAIKVTCILVGSIWGVIGVAWGYMLAPAIAWPISLWWLSRITRLPVRDLLIGALRSIAIGAVVATSAFAASQATAEARPVVSLLAGIAAGLAAAGVLLLVPRVRSDVRDVLHAVRVAAVQRRRVEVSPLAAAESLTAPPAPPLPRTGA